MISTCPGEVRTVWYESCEWHGGLHQVSSSLHGLHVLYDISSVSCMDVTYNQVPVTKHGGIRRCRRLGDTKTKLLMRAPCALFQAKSYVEGGSIWTLVTLHRACTIQVLVHAQSQLKLPDCRYHALNFSHSYTPHCFPPPLAPCPT